MPRTLLSSYSNLVKVKLTLNGKYEDIEGQENLFIQKFKSDVSKTFGIPIVTIKNVNVSPGSIKVEFSIVDDDMGTVNEAVTDMETKVKKGEFSVEFIGETYIAKSDSFRSEGPREEEGDGDGDGKETPTFTTQIIIIVIVGAGILLILLIIAVAVARRPIKKTQGASDDRRVLKMEEDSSTSSRENSTMRKEPVPDTPPETRTDTVTDTTETHGNDYQIS
ncbi:uncharacterized protein [Amphiura filiformis]|uniref:uncharacterized protein n=1 Tax=Amphiura filiformis TaxID=82378 RepID=UPI003B21F112